MGIRRLEAIFCRFGRRHLCDHSQPACSPIDCHEPLRRGLGRPPSRNNGDYSRVKGYVLAAFQGDAYAMGCAPEMRAFVKAIGGCREGDADGLAA